MPYTVTKQPDGDLSLGNLRGEFVTLQPAAADYATGGYLIEGIGESTENTGNVGLYKILAALPVGGQGGYVPVWNPATSKLQVFIGGSGSISIPVALNAGVVDPVYAGNVAGEFTTTGTATTITNGTVAGSVGAEVVAGTDLSAHSFQLLLLGL